MFYNIVILKTNNINQRQILTHLPLQIMFYPFQVGTWSLSVSNTGVSSTSCSATVTSRVSQISTSTFVTNVFWTRSNIQLPNNALNVVPQIVATLALGSSLHYRLSTNPCCGNYVIKSFLVL